MIDSARARLRAIDDSLSRRPRYRIARNALLGFSRRDPAKKAAGMTYFALFSIFPFILALIALFSLAIDSGEAQDRVISLLSTFLPAGSTDATQLLQGVIASRGAAGGLGVVLLLWGALGWFSAIDQAVNEMWGVERKRAFVKGTLFALAMISGIAGVMLLSWSASATLGILKGIAATTGVGLLPGWAALLELAVGAITLVLMFVVFLLLYRFSPMCDLSWREVWRGALITAFVWSAVRSGFALYVTNFTNYSTAYGPLGAVMAFLFWLYVAHMIILFGAQLTYAMRLEAMGGGEPDVSCAVPEEPSSQPRESGRARRAA